MSLYKTASWVLFFTLLLIGAASGENIDSLYQKGEEHLQNGLLKEAIICFEQVYALDPDFGDVVQKLIKTTRFYGIELYGVGRHVEALAYWQRTLELAPGNEEITAYINRAKNEMKTMGQLTGQAVPEEPAPIVQKPPEMAPKEEIPVRKVDTVFVTTYKVIPVAPEAAPVTVTGMETNIRFGLAYPSAAGDMDYNRGWALNIDMTPIHLTRNFGLELSGMYAGVNMVDDSEARLSIIGGNVGGAYNLKLPLLPAFESSAGLGIYNILHTGEISLVTSQSTTQETVSGYTLGLGLDRKMGSSRIGFSLEYLVLDSEFLDNVLLFNIGFGIN